MGTISIAALHEAIRAAWSADTSASADWTDGNRAKGQCAVTACVVHDHRGGDIVNTVATLPDGKTVSHYFNIIDGVTVDLTFEQFPEDTHFSKPAPRTEGFPSTRDYCLSYEHTRQRYELLSARVAAHLGS